MYELKLCAEWFMTIDVLRKIDDDVISKCPMKHIHLAVDIYEMYAWYMWCVKKKLGHNYGNPDVVKGLTFYMYISFSVQCMKRQKIS